MLKVYADEMQKKRLKLLGSEDSIDVDRKLFIREHCRSLIIVSCPVAIELESRHRRLGIFDPIMDAFNTGDFQLMSDFMRENCRSDVELSATSIRGKLCGIVPLLVFFGLLHETYPDAMVKILERRLCSTKKPVGKLQRDTSPLDADVVQWSTMSTNSSALAFQHVLFIKYSIR